MRVPVEGSGDLTGCAYVAVVRTRQQRSEVPYACPERLVLPDARVVYLDLNHWIAFARVVSGHESGERHREVFELCRRAVEGGEVVMPLSQVTYTEIMNRATHRQRQDICAAMELLSDGYQTIVSEFVLGVLEVDQALRDHGIRGHLSCDPVPYIGAGAAHGNGGRMIPRYVDRSRRDTAAESPAALHPIVRAMLDEEFAAQVLSRSMIAGPADEAEEQALRALGWNPESVMGTYEAMLESENAFAASLAEQEQQPDLLRGEQYDWRNTRTRDGAAGRELADRVLPCLEELNVSPNEVFDFDKTPEALQRNRELTDCLPTFDVAVTLKHSLHHDKRRWKINDIFDIAAQTAALPYCDVVCTDKGMRHHIDKTGIAQRLGTAVIDDLCDLSALIDE